MSGFPCQPFSASGLMHGLEDATGRGQIIFHVLHYISAKFPVSFILENVPGLVRGFPETLSGIVSFLRELRAPNDANASYEVHWCLLDTSVHGGLPQHRPRLYIVGIRRSFMQRPFSWPGPASRSKVLSDVLGSHCGDLDDVRAMAKTKRNNVLDGLTKLAQQGQDPQKTEAIIDCGGRRPCTMVNMCPCLTRTRCGDMGYYSTKRLRLLTIKDMMMLQGVDPATFEGWEDVVSQRQMGSIIGNAMSQNIMERVMRGIFNSVGIPLKGRDRWA